MCEGRKLTGDELATAAIYFAMSNMGMVDKNINKMVFDNKDNMKKLYGKLYGYFTSQMESDEMWDEVQPEIKSWNKMLSKGDDYGISEWDKLLSTGTR
jgi:hypothetical protein